MFWITLLGLVIILQVLGFVWYGPLFGRHWAEIIGMHSRAAMSPEENREFAHRMNGVYILNVVLTLVTVFSFIILVGASVLHPFIYTAVLLIGIVIPLIASFAIWSGKPRVMAWKMFGITAGYQVLSFFIIALTLTLL